MVVIVSGCLLGGCVSSTPISSRTEQQLPEFNYALFTPTPVVSADEIVRLTAEQQRAFFEFYNNPKFSLTPAHERVASYIGILLDQFTYSEETYTARQALEQKGGNCLSLTVLTTAFAQLAGVQISYQLLEQNPVYSIDNSLLITSDHLRAVLVSHHSSESGFDSLLRLTIDYFDTDGLSYVDNVSVEAQMSMFYSNRAADALVRGDYNLAFSNAERALQHYPENASALNTIGILHRKQGDLARAEKIYKFGLSNLSKGSIFVRNYVSLLANQERDVEIAQLLSEANNHNNDHPWQWVRAGRAEYQAGNYGKALKYYERAIKLAPEVHQLHLFAGRASYAAGDVRSSKRYLSKALALAKDAKSKRSYKKKLFALRSTKKT